MADIDCIYPLQWPEGRPFTPNAEKGMPTGVSPALKVEEALDYIRLEAREFKDCFISVTSDHEFIENPSLRVKSGRTNFASLIIDHKGIRYTIPCDKFSMLPFNLYALHLMLRNVQQMIKWGLGGTTGLDMLLAGYRANSIHSSASGSLTGNEWWLQYLGLGITARISDANAVYRARAKEIGHDSDMLLLLNEAISQARHQLS